MQLCFAASPGSDCNTVVTVYRPVTVVVDADGDYLVASTDSAVLCPSGSSGLDCVTVVGFQGGVHNWSWNWGGFGVSSGSGSLGVRNVQRTT